MRIIGLHREDPTDYSCISYWVLGENNTPSDRNTLIDTGSAHPNNLPFLLHEMSRQSKGIGKKAVEQIILTHGHFDHTGSLANLDEHFEPETFAWHALGRKPRSIRDGQTLMVGDQRATLLHTPGHSEDSLCVYLPQCRTLFSGDTLYRITDHLGAYPKAYLTTLERLAGLDIETIFPGHGHPITKDAHGFICGCLANVRQSLIQD